MLTRRRCCCEELITVTVIGCDSAWLPDATYSIWTDSSKTTLVFTGTSDALGQVHVSGVTAGVTYYREISHTAYVTEAGNHTYMLGTQNDSAGAIDSNHVCCCLLAKSTVLNWTSVGTTSGGSVTTVSGTGTWNNSANGWLLGNLWPGHPGFPVPGTLTCEADGWILTISYYDALVGDFLTCFIPPSALTCDPVNIIFNYPQVTCTRFPQDIGYVTFVVTLTS